MNDRHPDPTACRDFEDRLNQTLDQDPSGPSVLAGDPHLKQCRLCRDKVQTWRALQPLLASRSARIAAPSPDRLSPDRPSTRREIRWSATWTTVAAVCLLAWGFGWNQRREFPSPIAVVEPSPVQSLVSIRSKPIRITSPMMALVSSRGWVPHLSIPDTPIAGMPISGMIDRNWMERTTPAMLGLQTGIEPIERTFRTVARLIAGDSA